MTNIRAQYHRNAAQLRGMHAKAVATGKKVGGFTAAQLDERATAYERIAAMDDAALAAHLEDAISAITERMAR